MNAPGRGEESLADLCRQARALTERVVESRWPGAWPPGTQRTSAPASAPGAQAPPPPRIENPRPAGGVSVAGGASLEQIAHAVAGCTRCRLHEHRTNAVPGEGNPHAVLVFVGEGPGADEDRLGRPFVGAAGRLLDKMIAAMGLERAEVFIANVVKCRPPGNRDPLPDEIAACLPYLHAQLDLIRPRLICALGKFSAQTLLETKETITRLRGSFREYRGVPLMPTFHPSYLLRNEKESRDKDLVWKDLQQILLRLGLPIPAGRGRQDRR